MTGWRCIHSHHTEIWAVLWNLCIIWESSSFLHSIWIFTDYTNLLFQLVATESFKKKWKMRLNSHIQNCQVRFLASETKQKFLIIKIYDWCQPSSQNVPRIKRGGCPLPESHTLISFLLKTRGQGFISDSKGALRELWQSFYCLNFPLLDQATAQWN